MEEKYLIWHVQGGLGKNVAATALCQDIKEKYPDRKFILVCSYPEVFLNNPYIDKVYNLSTLSYFYETYIDGKDVIIFKHEPYFQTGHITQSTSLIENWCNLLDIEYKNQLPFIYINYAQKSLANSWERPKPILLLQTCGGPLSPIPNPDGTIPQSSQYSWSRDLPYEIAIEIVKKYSQLYHIIQVTKPDGYQLQEVERLDKPLSNIELASLVVASKKRILIDSCLQHMAAAFGKPSNVFWIATSPNTFGYGMHKNIQANNPKVANQLMYSYDFPYQFDNNLHECPYNDINDMFNIPEVLNSLGN